MIYPSTPTDHSGTITAGGTAQVAIPANARRKGFGVVNPATSSEALLVSFLGAASSSNSIVLDAGDRYEANLGTIPNTAISVEAATTDHVFVAWEY